MAGLEDLENYIGESGGPRPQSPNLWALSEQGAYQDAGTASNYPQESPDPDVKVIRGTCS